MLVCRIRVSTKSGLDHRIYYGKSGDIVIVLLLGGDKSSQEEDIKKAQAYWHESQGKRS